MSGSAALRALVPMSEWGWLESHAAEAAEVAALAVALRGGDRDVAQARGPRDGARINGVGLRLIDASLTRVGGS